MLHQATTSIRFAIVAIWTIAFVVALCVDAPVALFVHDSGVGSYVKHAKRWPAVLKAPGDFRFNLIVTAILVISRQIRWKQGVFVLLAGVWSGLNSVLKWIIGRYRPFQIPGTGELHPFRVDPFWRGLKGLMNQGPLSFPSGHACTSFALGAALVVVWPRFGWIFVCVAIVTGLERIAENAHYASDVVAATGLAMLGVFLIRVVLAGWIKAAA